VAREKRDLTQGSIPRNLIALALPLVAANLLQTTFNIVDMLFVGRLGPAAIAAVSLAGVITMFLMTIAIGLATGTQAMISRFIGAKDQQQAEVVAIQSLFLGIFSSFFLSIIGLFLSQFLLELVGAKGEVLSLGKGYLQIMFSGIYTVFLLFLVSAIFQGVGNTVTPMKILLFSTVSNIVFDPLLIFGIWFFPHWGVNGAAAATVTARGLGMLTGIYLLFKGKSGIYLHLQKVRIDLGMMWRIIRIGLFASLQAILRNISQIVVARIVASFGTYAIAAYGIGMRVRMVVMMPGFGLAAATAVLVGQNLGAKNPQRAEKSGLISSLLYSLFMVFTGSLFHIFAQPIISAFNPQPDVVRIGVNYLHVLTLSFVFLGIAIVLSRAMNGAGDTISPMVITGFTLLILRIPLCLFLSRILGTTGIWVGLAISDLANGLLTLFWFIEGRWKKRRI